MGLVDHMAYLRAIRLVRRNQREVPRSRYWLSILHLRRVACLDCLLFDEGVLSAFNSPVVIPKLICIVDRVGIELSVRCAETGFR